MILNEWGKIAEQYWLEMPIYFPNLQLDEFVVMPNHIHGIIVIMEKSNDRETDQMVYKLYERSPKKLCAKPSQGVI